METIRYQFADGTVSEIEVSDALYAVHTELNQQEKCNHWRETRRHLSLDCLNDKGIDFEDNAADPLDIIIRQEDNEQLQNALHKLSDKQRELAEDVFFEGMTLTKIAEREGVSQSAITQRLATVLRKLKKLL